MELKKNEIAGYYPYDLKVLEIFDTNESQVRRVTALLKTSIKTDLQRFPYTQEISFGSFKLILHPLSDLTKKGVYNGEEFVPIIKLLEFVMIAVYGNGVKIDKEYECFDESDYYGIRVNKGRDKIGFSFICESGWVGFTYSINGNKQKSDQLQLFQQLYKMKFDLHDLIKNKKAIDVNTLKINPYK